MPTTTITDWGDAIFLGISNALNTFLAAIPQVVGALLIILIGWIISSALARLVTAGLKRTSVDRLFAEHAGARLRRADATIRAQRRRRRDREMDHPAGLPRRRGQRARDAAGQPIAQRGPALDPEPRSSRRSSCWSRRSWRGSSAASSRSVPARWASANARLLGRLAEIAIIAFAVIIAIDQIGIAPNLVNTLFIGVVGALALAFGLAFGLGGREVAGQLTQSWYEASKSAAAQARSETRPIRHQPHDRRHRSRDWRRRSARRSLRARRGLAAVRRAV